MLGVIIIALFVWFVTLLDKRRIARSTRKIEQIHKNFYDYVDRNFKGDDAEFKKAEADLLIHTYWEKHLRTDYKPDKNVIHEVTTANKRKEMLKDMGKEPPEEVIEYRRTLTAEERIEQQARLMGVTVEEWTERLDSFKSKLSAMKEREVQ